MNLLIFKNVRRVLFFLFSAHPNDVVLNFTEFYKYLKIHEFY